MRPVHGMTSYPTGSHPDALCAADLLLSRVAGIVTASGRQSPNGDEAAASCGSRR